MDVPVAWALAKALALAVEAEVAATAPAHSIACGHCGGDGGACDDDAPEASSETVTVTATTNVTAT